MRSFYCAIAVVFATSASGQTDCPNIKDDDRRLACYDLENGVSETMSSSEEDTKWIKSVDTSKLTDDKTVILRLASDDDINGRFSGSRPASLILRCIENTTSAYFVFADNFMSDIQGYGNIDYRIDENEMRKKSFDVSTDNKALGLWRGNQAIPFIKSLVGSQALTVRATPYNESALTVTFATTGLENAVSELRETCNW